MYFIDVDEKTWDTNLVRALESIRISVNRFLSGDETSEHCKEPLMN